VSATRSRPPPPDEPKLSAEDFVALRDMVNAYCGIDLAPEQRASVERRLRDRLALAGVDSFGEYVRVLRGDPARGELDEAVEALTTNETYFFREAYQLRAFREEVVPLLAQRAQSRRRLSVWSAGCSTGEEVYTIAALLLESPELIGWDLRVFGSDINKRCLAHARRGVYGASAFRVTTPELRKRWFVERPDGWHVHERLRQISQFGHLNLLEPERATVVGRVDVVFCRNVLIYLGPRARRTVIDLFHERLYPGGVLLLGHSESLLNVSTAFELLHLREDLAYRKPLLSSGRGPFSAESAASRPSSDEGAESNARRATGDAPREPPSPGPMRPQPPWKART
jgi:chemotaxis protein methyltransferase CheR